ncbi:hypothetical protein EV356DRAFT_567689 [Viridothelium virens]|uniref:Uncharacterized protein n=1 Tax=Viridothelium virens TaxID=1048519 RepID=A0A6A6H7Q5_VIRVR|nr:hypothetical protein EV356DRAFT_567689 [Viridothelium virens]
MNGWGVFFIIVVVLLVLTAIGWIIFTHLRARRLGLPPPPLNPFASRPSTTSTRPYASPAPSGPLAWLQSTYASLRNRRTTTGAYEGTSLSATTPRSAPAGRHHGFGPLDPDEAWDARVGNEVDVYGPGGGYGEEDEELGLHSGGGGGAGGGGGGAYAGRGYAAPVTPGFGVGGEADARRGGGGGSRELDERYDEEMGRGRERGGVDPFGDHAERSDLSLRGVSPRPIDTGVGGGHRSTRSLASQDDSPVERRSMFRENV